MGAWIETLGANIMTLLRFNRAGAVFTEKCDSIVSVKEQYDVTGCPLPVESPFGKALSFDGASFIDVTDEIEKILNGATSFSVTARVKFDDTSATIGVFGASTGSVNGPIRCGILYSASKYYARLEIAGSGGANALTGTIELSPETWYTITWQYSAGDWSIYINGSPDNTLSYNVGSIKSITTYFYRIGFSTYYYMSGELRDLIVFDRGMSTQEIADLYYHRTFDYINTKIYSGYDTGGGLTYAPFNDTQITNIKNNVKSDASTSLGLTTIQIADFTARYDV